MFQVISELYDMLYYSNFIIMNIMSTLVKLVICCFIWYNKNVDMSMWDQWTCRNVSGNLIRMMLAMK